MTGYSIVVAFSVPSIAQFVFESCVVIAMLVLVVSLLCSGGVLFVERGGLS